MPKDGFEARWLLLKRRGNLDTEQVGKSKGVA